MAGATQRLTASPLHLLREALGDRQAIERKLSRAARTGRLWLDSEELERRMRCLEEAGYVVQRPTRVQLLFGALDMLRFVIVPAARDYYGKQGIDFNFHQVLRFLDDPVSLMDPTGILSERDTIIGHLLQVTHLNPIYDLQLMDMWGDGLAELERQVADMVAGTHPRARTIAAVIEDPGYHRRLLDYVRRYRADRRVPDLVREQATIRADEHFAAAERTFATLPGYLEYCRRLPDEPATLTLRYLTVRRFPVEQEVRKGASSGDRSPGASG
ncbi:MAG: hypothetical protein KC766_13275 [Myxococcales bacterium]|nr:hypothetical protein [Myxococcales bacterium]